MLSYIPSRQGSVTPVCAGPATLCLARLCSGNPTDTRNPSNGRVNTLTVRAACRTYSVQVADTVLVLKDGSAPEVLTRFSNAKWDAVSYDISEEPEDDDGDDDSDGEIDASRCAARPPGTEQQQQQQQTTCMHACMQLHKLHASACTCHAGHMVSECSRRTLCWGPQGIRSCAAGTCVGFGDGATQLAVFLCGLPAVPCVAL